MTEEFDAKINKDLNRFLDVCSIDNMFEIAIDAVPIVDMHEMMNEFENIPEGQEKEEMSVKLFVRIIYLLSKFAEKHAGKLCVIKSVFPNFYKQLEKFSETAEELNENGANNG